MKISILNFQARARGYLVRRKLFQMLEWYYKREKQIVRVQALWRGKRVRRLLFRQLTEARRRRKLAARTRSLRELAFGKVPRNITFRQLSSL